MPSRASCAAQPFTSLRVMERIGTSAQRGSRWLRRRPSSVRLVESSTPRVGHHSSHQCDQVLRPALGSGSEVLVRVNAFRRLARGTRDTVRTTYTLVKIDPADDLTLDG